jgi:hypothetical protein
MVIKYFYEYKFFLLIPILIITEENNMKKSWVTIPFAVITVIVLFVSRVPGTASATGIIQQPDIAGGSWTGGEETPLDLEGTTYPDWLQATNTNALLVTTKGEICHPFRGGQFGWVASIRQLVDGQWVKLNTTQGWMGDTEGSYLACATAQTAGTYAVFAYFDEKLAPVVESEPVFALFSFFNMPMLMSYAENDETSGQFTDWVAYFWYHSDYYSWTPGYSLEIYLGDDPSVFAIDKAVSYSILGDYPITGLEDMPATGTTLSWDDGSVYATFTDYVYTGDFENIPAFTNSIRVETGNGSYVIPLIHQTYDEVFE